MRVRQLGAKTSVVMAEEKKFPKKTGGIRGALGWLLVFGGFLILHHPRVFALVTDVPNTDENRFKSLMFWWGLIFVLMVISHDHNIGDE